MSLVLAHMNWCLVTTCRHCFRPTNERWLSQNPLSVCETSEGMPWGELSKPPRTHKRLLTGTSAISTGQWENREGNQLLMKNLKFQGKHKLADKWESIFYRVLEKIGDMPVYSPSKGMIPSGLYIVIYCFPVVTSQKLRKLNQSGLWSARQADRVTLNF